MLAGYMDKFEEQLRLRLPHLAAHFEARLTEAGFGVMHSVRVGSTFWGGLPYTASRHLTAYLMRRFNV